MVSRRRCARPRRPAGWPADRGHDLGNAITNGPAVLSVHVVTGLLLGLGAVGMLALAATARHLAADSMAMSVLAGAALLCYAAGLRAVRPSR